MGVVYEGVQLSVKRPVAIKVIRDELVATTWSPQRFLREAKLLDAASSHPNIVDVFDYGETDDGCFYIVMELLRGESLDVMLAQRGRVRRARRTCDDRLQICDALIAAHSHGVVHRDLKPANIIVHARARRLGEGARLRAREVRRRSGERGDGGRHDPRHAALHVAGADPRRRSSIRAATSTRSAASCSSCSPARRRFRGETSAIVIVRQLDDLPPALPANVPLGVAHLVASLLAKLPDERPPSALLVREALEVCIAAELGWLSACTS